MEGWCELISLYPESPEPKHLTKALRTADTLIATDLAPFEIEWLVRTFLYKPIDAINTIILKRVKEDWHKNIADIFKIISKIIGKYWIYIQKENEKLVQVCQLPFDPQTRKEAIYCLINILKNPGADVGDALSMINALESDTTCKAPLALLVGSLCRYCPESVDQNYNRIWRIFLNILQAQNKTDTVMNAVLQGIDGLLENFGRDISIQELQCFYKDFSRKCAKISKCIEPLLSILKSHSALFREKLVEDKVLRLYVWSINSPNIRDALLAIYTVIFADVPKERIEIIIRSEIRPYIYSELTLVKHTAFRIIIDAKIYYGIHTSLVPRPDHLEFQMRYRRISHQETDLVSLCLESQESYVKSLLMSALMYYEHVPITLRRDLVVKGIQNSIPEARKVTLILLIELCKQDGCLDKYADIWRDILDTENKGDMILKETLQIMASQLKSLTENPIKDIQEVLSLSNVLCYILSASETYDPCQYSDVLKSSIDDLAACMCVCPSVILSSKYLCVEMFKSRSILKELLSAFKKDLDEHTLLIIQMVFNNIKADCKLQVKALSELDRLLKSKDGLDQRQVADIIKKIVKLKTNKIVATSDSRILQRDLTMFIGEHGDRIEKEDFCAQVYSLDFKNKITLNIPNITEGTNYKLDLLRMVQICLQWADFEMLYCLLVVITANLRDRPDPTLQSMTWKCVHALYSSDGCADVTSAIRMCVTTPCVQLAIQSIKEERSPEVRKKLCQSLQVMLLHDPGSEANGELLTLVAEELVLMLKSTEESLYQSGIDIAKVYLQTLHNHDNLTITYLPKILMESSRKIDKDLYKISTDMFIEKIDVFDETQIKEIWSALFKCTLKNYNRIDLEYILQFLKRIFDVKCYEFDYFVNEIILGLDTSVEGVSRDNDFESFANLFQTLALSKLIFNFNEDESKSVITANNFAIINQISTLLDEKVNINILRNILKFVIEFSDELLGVKTEQTIECCCKIIENTTPDTLFLIKKELYDLSLCLRKNTSVLPEKINLCCEKWCEKINLKEITDCFYDPCDLFAVSDTLDSYSDSIHSLSVMAKTFDCRITDSAELTTLLINHTDEIRQSIVTDLLSISEQCLTLSEFGNILETDIEFVQKHIDVFFKKLLVYSESVTVYSTVFVSAVKYFADNYKRYEQYYENIVVLFDKVFPKFELMDFEEQLLVASDIYRLPRTNDIPLLIQWARRTITAEDTSLSRKIQIITVLPGGEEYSICYRYMAGLLPVRLSEVQGDHAAILRCLLDSLASCGDLTLLDIIVTLAAADETKGWWNDAMDACMASLSDRRDEKIFDTAYNACKKRANLGGCTRVFVPLLRHSSRTYCEEYACKIIIDVLDTFKRGFIVPSNTELYRERVLSYAKAFTILQVIIDKVPSKNLESGIINMSAGYQDAWHVIKDVCVYSVTLRDKVRCPDNATDAIKEACLRLQCSAYNCLTSAICKRRPSQKQYTAVFNLTAWSNVVDTGVQYDFTPRPVWNDNRIKINSDMKTTSSSTSTFTGTTGTVRTRLFMATLSENPLQYDMIPNYEDEEEVEEDRPEPYENHPLNAHGILSTITELLVHATTLHHTDWLDTLTMALSSSSVNVKWTLAQAICNAELALKPHASVLAPALLELVANTPKLMGGTQVFNNLHIDMLWTILRWQIKELSTYDNLNICIQLNIATCIEFRLHDGIFRRMLSTLNNLLQMFGGNVDIKWSFLQNYCNDLPINASYLLPILQRVLKNGIPLPGLLSLYDRFDPRVWTSTSKLPEVFALALSLEDNKRPHLIKFRQLLMNVRNISIGGYVKILLYTQKICWECCDLNNLRIIVDLAPKVEKAKCLSIIATYLENMEHDEDGFCAEMFDIIGLKELLDGDCVVEAMKVVHGGLKLMDPTLKNDLISGIKMNCHNCSAKVRKEAYRVMLKVFQDIVLVKPSHSAKRKAMENTPILDIFFSQPDHHEMMAVITDGIFDGDEEIADMMRGGVEGCLSKDMSIRFAELFFIIFNFAKNDLSELSDYGYVFLDLLFRDLRQQEGFKNKKLSDQPLPTENDNDFGLSRSTETIRSIDVQMLLTDIFQVFLESAKSNSQICEELLIEIMKRLKGTGRRFDFDETIGKLLTEVLKKEPNCLTPYYIEATRMLLNNIAPIDEFKNTLNVLKSKVQDSDCSAHFGVLYEDWMLKCEGRDLFNFSFKEDDIVMNENQEFSIEGLTEVFGLLSNWEDLRIQDRKRVEESLPPLLIQAAEFESSLKEYFEAKHTLDYSTWFHKMVGAYCSSKLGKPVVQYKEHWLKDAEKWPPRDYVTSAVLESIRLFSNDAEFRSCEIKPSECLAEWAARLMIRSCYFKEDLGLSMRCRADELQFCHEANIRSLPKIALQCIERNKDSLLEDEALSWFHEKVVAHRTLALRNNDRGMLQKALDATERQNIGDNVCLQKTFLQLHYDLGKLSKPKLDEILININRNVSTDKGVLLSNKNAESVRSVYDMAMNYYDGLWQSNDKSIQEDIISSMLDIIYKKLNYNLFTDHNLLIAILWNQLINFDGILSENLAQKLLELIAILEPNLDAYSKQYIRTFSNIFSTSIHNKYSDTDGNEPVYLCKQYLQLIRDPQYALLHYCDKLFYAKDQENYKTTFNDMKKTLFENKHGGTEYKSLNTIKNKLYGIENVDNIVSRHRVLKNIMDELKSKVQRSVLRLSQLSPELTKPSIMEIQRTSFQALLGLPTNVYVVKFLEQIQVFKDAIRRPCVLTAVLSNGTMKRYIVKSGEPLYNDASVQRAIAILPKLCRRNVRSYNVTALAEDAAIIEYLEDHERLRELMGDTVNVAMSQRLADDKLISSPSLALEQFKKLCNKVPLNTLRSAIENRCASVQEFIRKKQTFLETLCSMTVTNWLFGVGDRHLQNILIDKKDGGLCGVDWSSTFHYGLREYVPARLTHNILAVCDATVLESRLQNMLLCLRENYKIYEAFINISFHWRGNDFHEMKYISNILRGSSVSYQITRQVLEEKNVRLKEEYIKTLDSVFEDYPKQHTYSVEEQVRCLLKHCTDERILSITPQGWEAWL